MPAFFILCLCVIPYYVSSEAGFYQPYFSQKILDEATNSLIRRERMTPEKAARYQAQIKEAFPEAMVEISEALVNCMTNHPKDRHVLAAAVIAKADLIITFNLKDFPQDALKPFAIEAQHPDNFLLDLCENFSVSALAQIIQEQADSLKKPPTTISKVLNKLSSQVPQFAGKILCREYGHEIVRIAEKALKIGSCSPDGEKIYKGKQYCLRKTNNTLTITHQNSRGEILKLESGKIERCLLLEDLENFQEFEQKLEAIQS